MSEQSSHSDQDIPRFEPWVAVIGSSIIPVVASVYLPSVFLVPLIVSSVVLFALGLFLLHRQTVRQSRPDAEAS
jgi:hypothetical protein